MSVALYGICKVLFGVAINDLFAFFSFPNIASWFLFYFCITSKQYHKCGGLIFSSTGISLSTNILWYTCFLFCLLFLMGRFSVSISWKLPLNFSYTFSTVSIIRTFIQCTFLSSWSISLYLTFFVVWGFHHIFTYMMFGVYFKSDGVMIPLSKTSQECFRSVCTEP